MTTPSEMVTVLINGAPYVGWKKVTAKVSFDECAGEATLCISAQPGVPLPIHLGDEAVIIFGTTPVITGNVREVSGGHEWQSHDIEVHIRDRTQDFVQSTIGPKLPKMDPPIALKDVLTNTLGTMGLSRIGVIDKVNPPPYGPAEVVQGAIDDRGFNFADRWAQKRQVLMTSDGKGNLVIDRNMKRRGPGMVHKGPPDDPLNNVLKDTYKNSDLERENTTGCCGQKSTNDKKHWESKPKGEQTAQADPLQQHWGYAVDTAIRPELKMHYRGGRGIDGETPEKSAAWRASVARGRGFQYGATLQGFDAAPGVIWWPGFIVPVYSWAWEIADDLLIKDCTFEKDWEGGSRTTLTLVPGDSFSDQAQASAAPSRGGGQGMGTAAVGSFAKAVV